MNNVFVDIEGGTMKMKPLPIGTSDFKGFIDEYYTPIVSTYTERCYEDLRSFFYSVYAYTPKGTGNSKKGCIIEMELYM